MVWSSLCLLAAVVSHVSALLPENEARITFLNSLHNGVVFGENQFSDMTEKEFRAKILMTVRGTVSIPEDRYLDIVESTNVTSFDWRSKGAVTRVKDQGTVGTCWSFSTTGNLEGQWFIHKNVLPELSEEFLVDCDSNDCGVFGGWPYLAYEYIKSVGGIPSESSYPYCSGTGECYPCMANLNRTFCGPPPEYCNKTWDKVHCPKQDWTPQATLSDWQAISKDEDQIATQLVNIGPLSVLMDATGLQHYKGGVYESSGFLGCTTTDLNHAVLIVGFGEESGKKYWIVKNSWGPKWGENGYFRIIRGKGECGINTAVTTAIV